MEKVCGIYRIVCVTNGNYYYGSSHNIRRRWTEHQYLLRRGKHTNLHVQYTWNKYGESSFRIELTELVNLEQLEETEDRYLKEHVGRPHCMNIHSDANHTTLSAETKERIGKAGRRYLASHPEMKIQQEQRRREYFNNPETYEIFKKAVSEGLKEYYSQLKDNTRRREALKAICSTPECRQARSNAMKAHYANPDNRKKQCERMKEVWKRKQTP